jgi:small subunit ribosomal protein S6
MRRYETIIIIDPDLSEEDRSPLFERFEGLIPQLEGMAVEFDEWGVRKLAYEVKKKTRGYYLRLDYCGTGALVDEIERFCRIDDRVLKYMTVLLDKDVDLEALKKAMAEAEAKQAAAVQEEAAAAAVQEEAAAAAVQEEAAAAAVQEETAAAAVQEETTDDEPSATTPVVDEEAAPEAPAAEVNENVIKEGE